MLFRSSRLRLLMVMPLVSARWMALPAAMWACLKGICRAKQRGHSVSGQAAGLLFHEENGCDTLFWLACFPLGQCKLKLAVLGWQRGGFRNEF